NRQLTLGQLVAGELIVTLIVASLAKFGKYAEVFYDLVTSAEKLGLLADLPVQKQGGSNLQKTSTGMDVRIIQPVISHQISGLDLHFVPSERALMVGPNTSEVFEMISGLRVPRNLHIELDGIDVRGISMMNLDGQIGFISNPEILPGSVYENISLGRLFVGDVEVRETLQRVGLLNKVMSLPDGLDTIIGKERKSWSAQEEVLITIARVIVGKPRLLILDKILDVLDHTTRKRILGELMDPKWNWTLLVSSNNPEVASLFGRQHEVLFLENKKEETLHTK
ncbi:MAG: ATP-binding cassette domain-containing protein, partial [Planctomycetia bacterium]